MGLNKKEAMFGLDFEPLRKQFGKLFLAKRQSEAPEGANGSCGLIKHGAMFGLDFESLRKQFGELFLAKRQSKAQEGANGSCGLIKHGAMFGLDARIALAIFGALSVISGAALYSAIKESKTVSLIVELNEIGKAWEQYLLDTGQNMPSSTSLPNHIETLNFIENDAGVTNWKGPYLDSNRYVDASDGNGAWLADYKESPIRRLVIISFYNANGGACAVDNCYLWVRKDFPLPELSLIKDLDEKIDSVAGAATGKVMYKISGGNDSYILTYKYAPVNYNLVF